MSTPDDPTTPIPTDRGAGAPAQPASPVSDAAPTTTSGPAGEPTDSSTSLSSGPSRDPAPARRALVDRLRATRSGVALGLAGLVLGGLAGGGVGYAVGEHRSHPDVAERGDRSGFPGSGQNGRGGPGGSGDWGGQPPGQQDQQDQEGQQDQQATPDSGGTENSGLQNS